MRSSVRFSRFLIFITTSLALLLTGCGQNFEVDLANPCLSNSCSQGGGGDGGGSWSWKSLDVDSTVDGGQFDNVQVLSISTETPHINLFLPIIPNPHISNFTKVFSDKVLEVRNNSTGTLGAILKVPLTSVIDTPGGATSRNLPNGDLLPGLSGKVLGYEAAAITADINVHVYTGDGTLALYVDSPYDPYMSIETPIKRRNNEVIGRYVLVPQKNSAQGGFFISMTLDDSEIQRLRENL